MIGWSKDTGWIGDASRTIVALTTLFERIPLSLPLLLARIALAATLYKSAQTKIAHDFAITDHTIFLFRDIYRIPFLDPTLTAYFVTYTELLCIGCLAFGLASRFSAFALIFLTVAMQLLVFSDNIYLFATSAVPHTMWVALSSFVLVLGPGVLSLDHLLFRRSM